MMIQPLFLALLTFFPLSQMLAQTPTQTLRGTVTDAVNAQPLQGATISLPGTEPLLGTVADSSGHFRLGNVPVGRYQLQVSHLGCETLTLAEVQVAGGRETVLDVQLSEHPESLSEVVVQAQAQGNLPGHSISVRTITVEEQFRFPATFYDPARLASSFPGVAAADDQANHLSVRGNSPNAVAWRLEGVEIVNPNHTANAGNFSDRPSLAGGGVNILSAQVLGTSQFFSGNFPAGYGNAMGGLMDMHFRPGNDQQHQFVAQAGVLGLEAAAEGPFGSSPVGSSAVRQSGASYLVNYRYSFTGLLGLMGIDFDGEEIAFQDLSFHLNFPTKKMGEFGLFGLGGKSKNIFTSPSDPTDITEDKQRFDIDFRSQMGAIGVTHDLPLGQKTALRTVLAYSALEHERTADLVAFEPSPQRWDDDRVTESKLSFSSIFSKKINARHRLRTGLQAMQLSSEVRSLYTDRLGSSLLTGELDGWLVQPFAEWQARLSPKWELTAGLQLSQFTQTTGGPVLEPRAMLSFLPNARQRLSLGYARTSQVPLAPTFDRTATERPGPQLLRSTQVVLAWRQTFQRSLVLTAEAYHQRLTGVSVSALPADNFSVLNLTGYAEMRNQQLRHDGTGRNYGLDVSLQRFFAKGTYGLLSGSVYRSQYTAADGEERPTRWDGRYLGTLTAGREWTKQKTGKTRVLGLNWRMAWLGGFRDREVAVAASQAAGRTVFLPGNNFSERLGHFSRWDLRLYLRWERPGRSSLLSLDIQNLLNEKNDAYRYFDALQDRTVTKRQLGMIPVLSWRVEF